MKITKNISQDVDPKIPILPVLQVRKIPPPQPRSEASVGQPSANLYSTIEDVAVISENKSDCWLTRL